MNFRNFDLNLLRVFDVLMEEKSVSRAAIRLGLTQSSTSNALNRLRTACDDNLLERSGNAMVPSRMAIDLWPHVRIALSQLETGLRELEQFLPAKLEATVRIGIDPYSLIALGSEFLSELQEQAPLLKISYLNADPHMKEQALRDGDIDLIIGPVWKATPGLQRQVLFTETFVGVVRTGHPLSAKQGPVDLDAFLAYRHMLFSEVGLATGNVDSALKTLKKNRKVSITLPSYTIAAEFIERSDFIINLGSRVAQKLCQRYSLATFDLPLKVPGFDVAVLWASRNTDSKLHAWLRETITEKAKHVLN